MRILFLQDKAYFGWAAGVKINRFLAHDLAERGHDVRAVVALGDYKEWTYDPVADEKAEVLEQKEKYLYLNDRNTVVTACHRVEDFPGFARAAIRDFRPDILLYSESSNYGRLEVVPADYLARTIVTVHCTEILPFGPSSCLPNVEASALFKATGGAIVVCKFLRDYLAKYAGKESVVLHFPGYGSGPFPNHGCFSEGFVSIVNASDIKGLPIFLALARQFPAVEFGAVCSWATTSASLEAIAEVPNVRIIEANPDIDAVFRQTRILLAPSLWQEAFPITVIEAELRGIPVIAGDVGGLPEAKFGTGYVLPVNPVTEWEVRLSSNGLSLEPRIPEQDIAPWVKALETLLRDRQEYESLSQVSRLRAHEFLNRIDIQGFEDYFIHVLRSREN